MPCRVQIARHHWEARYPDLWRGLEAFYSPRDQGQSGNVLFDYGPHKRHGTLEDGASWAFTDKGWAIDFRGDTNTDHVYLGQWNIPSTQLTLWLCLYADSYHSNDPRFISKADGTSSADHDWMIGVQSSSGGDMRARIGRSSNTAYTDSNPPVGEWYYPAVTHVNGDSYDLAWNGETPVSALWWGTDNRNDTGGPTLGNISTNNNHIYIGNNRNSSDTGVGSNGFNGRIVAAGIWSRALLLSELSLLSQDITPLTPSSSYHARWQSPGVRVLNPNVTRRVRR